MLNLDMKMAIGTKSTQQLIQRANGMSEFEDIQCHPSSLQVQHMPKFLSAATDQKWLAVSDMTNMMQLRQAERERILYVDIGLSRL